MLYARRCQIFFGCCLDARQASISHPSVSRSTRSGVSGRVVDIMSNPGLMEAVNAGRITVSGFEECPMGRREPPPGMVSAGPVGPYRSGTAAGRVAGDLGIGPDPRRNS